MLSLINYAISSRSLSSGRVSGRTALRSTIKCDTFSSGFGSNLQTYVEVIPLTSSVRLGDQEVCCVVDITVVGPDQQPSRMDSNCEYLLRLVSPTDEWLHAGCISDSKQFLHRLFTYSSLLFKCA